MYGSIQRWGNSQGVRIPKSVLSAAKLRENDRVEIVADEQGITLRKAREYKDLDALFAGYEGETRVAEFDTGEAVGREVLE